MKKFLLSLLTVFAASSAFAVTDVLTTASFGSPSSYANGQGVTYTSTETSVKYGGYFTTGTGNSIQMNTSKSGTSVYSSENPEAKDIKRIAVNVASGTNTINIWVDDQPFTTYSSNPDHGTRITQTKVSESFEIAPGYKYFLITSNSGVIYLSSIEVEYEDAVDPRTYVTLSFPEKLYNAFLGEEFDSPALSCDVDDALSSVVYSSSDETVATVDANGNVTILDDGATTISAYIPEDNTDYRGATASYDLIVKDPNAIETVLNTDFFQSSGYNIYTAEDSQTKIEYTTVQYKGAGGTMQFNTKSYPGCGIAVTTISPNYIIASINIEYSTVGSGLNVYKQDKAFAKTTSTDTAFDLTDATKIGSTVKENATIAIGAPAFAIVPESTGMILVTSVTVTYAKKVADDGSELFECEDFHDYMICKDEMVEIILPEDAPEITYTSSKENVASVEDGHIMALDYGNTVITASWEAVPGKWMAGSEEFTVYVKYATLAEVLADAHDKTSGFVKVGETYVGNFPVVVGSDQGKYNYVTDGTAWALFYVDHNHGEGAVLEAGWSATVSEYHGLIEFTKVQHSDITDYTGEFDIKVYDNLEIGENALNEVLVLNDVTFTETTPDDAPSSREYYIGYYNGQEVKFFNQFAIDPVPAGTYNVEGAVTYYDGVYNVLPTEYKAQEATTDPTHDENNTYSGGEVIRFTHEEGSHIYYRLGTWHIEGEGDNAEVVYDIDDPDHTNVFTDAPQSAPMKAVDPTPEFTFNHSTHPLTFEDKELVLKYMAKAPGKAPSAIKVLSLDSNGGDTTGIEAIAVDAVNGEVEYFNLQGQRVENPAAGLYIMRQGSKVQKVLVK